jgi:formate-dependent nitrite reductase cytochrome c552 subunit
MGTIERKMINAIPHAPRGSVLAFSADYRERRGHAYMLEDQTFTARQAFNPPAMCINCHASMVTTFLKLGDGDLVKGFNVISDTHMTLSADTAVGVH